MPVPEVLADHGFAREDGMKVLEGLDAALEERTLRKVS